MMPARKQATAKKVTTAPVKKTSQRDRWKATLEKLQADAEKAFPGNPGKTGQLKFHLSTAAMVVDELHDTTPAQSHTIL